MAFWQPMDEAPKDGSRVDIRLDSMLSNDSRVSENAYWVPEKTVEMLCCDYCGDTYEYTQIEGWFSKEGIRLSNAFWRIAGWRTRKEQSK